MADSAPRLFDLTLTGQLALDFANTVDWRTSDHPKELLNSYADLVRWAQYTGVFSEGEARRILREAAQRPEEASAALEGALGLRETLYRIFSAGAASRPAAKADLDLLNSRLRDALSNLRVAPSPEGFAWEWAGEGGRLDRMLWPVVRAAAEMLVDGEAMAQLRECANGECGWLFVDTSRNRSRRWCSMGVCGNRAKARRHYEQVRANR